MKNLILAVILIFHLIVAVAWIGNIVKLLDCDFDAPFKGEFIHAVGLFIPYAAVGTVWNEDK